MPRYTRRLSPFWVALELSLAICVGASADPPANSLAGATGYWKQLMEELSVPGMAIVVVKNDTVIANATLGIRNLKDHLPVTPQTRFYIASDTKPFVAATVLSMVEDRLLELKDPVRKYLPRFRLSDTALTQRITIEDLLCHRYGINSDQIVFLDAFTGNIDENRYYRLLEEATIAGQPEYSNVHYTLLGRVIEAVSGHSWKDEVKGRILGPAGLTRTTTSASQLYDGNNFAEPMISLGGAFQPVTTLKTDKTMHAAGGMATTSTDLGNWMRILLKEGRLGNKRILSEESVQRLLNVKSTVKKSHLPPPLKWVRKGFSDGFHVSDFEGIKAVELGGNYPGASAFVMLIPDSAIGVGVLANVNTPVCMIIIADVLDRLLGTTHEDLVSLLKPVIAHQASTTEKNLARVSDSVASNTGQFSLTLGRYVGSFHNDLFGQLSITSERRRLEGTLGALDLLIAPTTKDDFITYSIWNPHSAGGFEIEDGKVRAVRIEFFSGDTAVFHRQ